MDEYFWTDVGLWLLFLVGFVFFAKKKKHAKRTTLNACLWLIAYLALAVLCLSFLTGAIYLLHLQTVSSSLMPVIAPIFCILVLIPTYKLAVKQIGAEPKIGYPKKDSI